MVIQNGKRLCDDKVTGKAKSKEVVTERGRELKVEILTPMLRWEYQNPPVISPPRVGDERKYLSLE